jgi:phenylacetate-coenzyme A ligase PaaK-like adenylate-forming protein
MTIEIEPEDSCDDPASLADRVAAALRNTLGFRVPVSPVPRGVLPRFEGKAKRWVRK